VLHLTNISSPALPRTSDAIHIVKDTEGQIRSVTTSRTTVGKDLPRPDPNLEHPNPQFSAATVQDEEAPKAANEPWNPLDMPPADTETRLASGLRLQEVKNPDGPSALRRRRSTKTFGAEIAPPRGDVDQDSAELSPQSASVGTRRPLDKL
jgi:hypothetical protein